MLAFQLNQPEFMSDFQQFTTPCAALFKKEYRFILLKACLGNNDKQKCNTLWKYNTIQS